MAGGDVYVFIDESGNFDFSSGGSKYFYLTAIVTDDPLQGAKEFLEWRHRILKCDEKTLKAKRPRSLTHFHCTEDAQYTRDGVFKIIEGLSFDAYNVRLQKDKTNPSIRSMLAMYRHAFRGLIRGIVARKGTAAKFHIFASQFQLPKTSNPRAFIKALKGELATDGSLRYEIHFHSTQTHHMLQVSDYVCWAIARKWEGDDPRSYQIIRKFLGDRDFDFFRKGTTIYPPD